MIRINITVDNGRVISTNLNDWEAVELYATGILEADIGIDYLEYIDGNEVGLFNLANFNRC